MATYNAPQVFREEIRMTGAAETSDCPILSFNGTTFTINSAAKAVTFAGATTFSGAVTVSGVITTAGFTVPVLISAVLTGTATVSVSSAYSGGLVIATATSSTQTFQIPAASTAGLRYTFRVTSAASELLINSASASDTFSIKATGDAGASVVTSAGTGIKNTAATNVVGDNITLTSDGITGWHGTAQSGIWATQ